MIQELVGFTVIDDSSISSASKNTLKIMRELISTISQSSDNKKQEKMITLFLGGVLLVLHQEDQRYNYSPKLYPRLFVKDALRTLSKNSSDVEKLYAVGREALENLPVSFCGALFTQKVPCDSHKPDETRELFVNLAANSQKVDCLVKFCIFCIEHSNLEYPTAVASDHPYPFPPTLDFVVEFNKRHAKSYNSGFLGGFFNRTKLPPLDHRISDKILAHALEPTFFGFKNRTRNILEEMGVMRDDGHIIEESSVRKNQI